MAHYDLIIIGGGPAGYISAERAGARGKKVLLVEHGQIGGVCLNEGCVPTKTLLYSSKLYHQARNSQTFGVTANGVQYDLIAAMAHKAKTIKALQKGILAQLKHHSVEIRNATASFLGPGRVTVDGEEHSSEYVLLATGSRAIRPPIPGTKDHPAVLTSSEALELSKLPNRLVIVGGGYIGMEFASFFAAVGTKVTVVEMTDEIIPMLEPTVAEALRKQIPDVEYKLGHRVTEVSGGADRSGTVQVAVTPADRSGGDSSTVTIDTDLVLLAAGRAPNVEGAGFDAAGLDYDRSGVTVDEYMQTNLPGVYAAGDVTGKILLAHAAYRMGEVAVAHMFREDATATAAGSPSPATGAAAAAGRSIWPNRMRYHAIPWVVFTSPEVAGCGFNPTEAADAGYDAISETLPLQVSGRYLAEHPRERGTVTIVADRATRRLLGVQMLGSGVGEIIHSASAMIEQELRIEDIREVVFPHPTVSEALRDAAWAIQ
ncbi:MAG: dihydrolipoyl dehydrogenase [Alkalispirochaeta sp.]